MSDPTAALSMPKPQMVRAALLFHSFPCSHMCVICINFKRVQTDTSMPALTTNLFRACCVRRTP